MSNTPDHEFDKFLDSYVQELIAMKDEEILEGQDAARLKADGLVMLQRARTEAGRRKLAEAKVAVAAKKTQPSELSSPVGLEEARAFIERATNDSRYTLAARDLKQMSDDEVLSLYAQIKSLEDKSGEDA